MILALFLLTGCATATGTFDNTSATPTDDDLSVDSVQDIAAEFKSLRAIQGHFDGGDWNADVDEWMGRKHQLMIQLESLLGTGEYSRAEVLQLLDPPDLIARNGDDLFDQISNLAEFEGSATSSYEFLIYYWRGTHDFLYFTTQDEIIINSGWWYAGE